MVIVALIPPLETDSTPEDMHNDEVLYSLYTRAREYTLKTRNCTICHRLHIVAQRGGGEMKPFGERPFQEFPASTEL
jgi:hypothetical protein